MTRGPYYPDTMSREARAVLSAVESSRVAYQVAESLHSYPLASALRVFRAQARQAAENVIGASMGAVCRRRLSDGRRCGLQAPCPDCGTCLIDVSEGS